jgi:hypothetical protein
VRIVKARRCGGREARRCGVRGGKEMWEVGKARRCGGRGGKEVWG